MAGWKSITAWILGSASADEGSAPPSGSNGFTSIFSLLFGPGGVSGNGGTPTPAPVYPFVIDDYDFPIINADVYNFQR